MRLYQLICLLDDQGSLSKRTLVVQAPNRYEAFKLAATNLQLEFNVTTQLLGCKEVDPNCSHVWILDKTQ